MQKEMCRNLPCIECKKEIDPDKFYWGVRISRLGKTLRRCSRCKLCLSNIKKQVRITNIETTARANFLARKWKMENKDKVRKQIAAYMNSPKGKVKRAAIQMNRKAAQLCRTPSWADLCKIEEFYEAASFATEFFGQAIEVDHIIPLQGKLVSGLHVDTNLRLLTASENAKKYNTFVP